MFSPTYNSEPADVNWIDESKRYSLRELTRDTTTLNYLMPNVIIKGLLREMEPNMTMAQLATIKTFKGKTVTYTKATQNSVLAYDDIPEGGEIKISAERYSTFEVTPTKMGCRIDMTREVMEDSWVADVWKSNVQQQALQMAKTLDTKIYNEIAANGTGFTGADPLTLRQLVEAMTDIRELDYEPNTLVLNPTQYGQLMAMDEFRDSARSFQAINTVGESFLRGQISRLYGSLDIIVTNHALPAGTAIMMDRRSNLGGSPALMLFQNRVLKAEDYKDATRDVQGYVVTMRNKPKIVWKDAVHVMTGLGSTI